MAKLALMFSREATGVYFVPNPVDPALHARRPDAAAEYSAGGLKLTTDADIVERKFLIVDCDTVRWRERDDPPGGDVSGLPATAQEVVSTIRTAERVIIPAMRGFGFADPVVMMSGNGVHLVYRTTLPLPGGVGDVETGDPGRLILRGLAAGFDSGLLRIDPATANPCRMLKVPGTMVRKGVALPHRPHRVARVRGVPDGWPRA